MQLSEFTLLFFSALFDSFVAFLVLWFVLFLCTLVHCSPTIVLLSVSSPTFPSLFVLLHFPRLLGHAVSSRWPWRSSTRIDKALCRNLRILTRDKSDKFISGDLTTRATHRLNPAGPYRCSETKLCKRRSPSKVSVTRPLGSVGFYKVALSDLNAELT